MRFKCVFGGLILFEKSHKKIAKMDILASFGAQEKLQCFIWFTGKKNSTSQLGVQYLSRGIFTRMNSQRAHFTTQ